MKSSMISATGRFLDLAQYLVKVKCCRLLTGRKLQEDVDLLRDECLHLVEKVGM